MHQKNLLFQKQHYHYKIQNNKKGSWSWPFSEPWGITDSNKDNSKAVMSLVINNGVSLNPQSQ